MFRCACYYRVSSETQKQAKTIQSQKSELPKFAKSQGWDVVKEYEDEGISGSFIQGRVEFTQMLEDAKKREFDILLVAEWSRLTRSEDEMERALILRTLRESEIQLASLNGGILRNENLDDQLIAMLNFWMPAKEREDMVRRMKRGKKEKLRNNQYCLPSLVFGLKKKTTRDENGRVLNHEIVLHPEESKTLRKIYNWIVQENLTFIDICARLNKLGLKTKRGKEWGPGNLSSLLRREESLTGTIICNRTRQKLIGSENGVSKYKKYPMKNKSEWIIVKAPKIFTANEYKEIRKKVKSNKVRHFQNQEDEFILRGLMTCGICGNSLHCRHGGNSGDKKIRYYVCGKKILSPKLKTERCMKSPWINGEVIEKLVLSKLITNLLRNPDKTLKAFNQAGKTKTAQNEIKAKIKIIDKEFKKIDEKEERLLEFSLNNLEWTDETLGKKLSQLKAEREMLKEERTLSLESLRISQTKEKNNNQLQTFGEDIKKFSKGLIKEIKGMNVQDKQKLCRIFLGDSAQVVVEEDFNGKAREITGPLISYAGKVRGPIVLGWSLKGSLNLAVITEALKSYHHTGKLPQTSELKQDYLG